MKYSQGSIGRVFVARLEDGESIYDVVEEIGVREDISAAAVMAVGGMRSGRVVTGPEESRGKIVPHVEEFDDAREMVGFGTLFRQEGKPLLHFHAGIGRRDTALVGCPRQGMSVFLVLEVVIVELLGIEAARELEPAAGLHLLSILNGRDR